MTATEQLIAKQVSDVFPASVDDLPLQDAARRGLIAPLRNLRVPPAAAINSVPIVGGDFDERARSPSVLDHQALNQAAASLYRDRFDSTPGIVYAAGVDHAYNLAQEFRAAGLEGRGGQRAARRRSGSPRSLAAYERGEIDVLINAMLARRGLELAARDRRACTSRRPRRSASTSSGSAGSCACTRARRRASSSTSCHEGRDAQRPRRLAAHRCSDADFYREGARVTPAPRRRVAAPRAPPAHARAVARPGHARRPPPPRGHPARVAADRPAATSTRTSSATGRRSPAARSRFDERADFVKKLTDGKREQGLRSSSSSPRRRPRTRTAGCG